MTTCSQSVVLAFSCSRSNTHLGGSPTCYLGQHRLCRTLRAPLLRGHHETAAILRTGEDESESDEMITDDRRGWTSKVEVDQESWHLRVRTVRSHLHATRL